MSLWALASIRWLCRDVMSKRARTRLLSARIARSLCRSEEQRECECNQRARGGVVSDGAAANSNCNCTGRASAPRARTAAMHSPQLCAATMSGSGARERFVRGTLHRSSGVAANKPRQTKPRHSPGRQNATVFDLDVHSGSRDGGGSRASYHPASESVSPPQPRIGGAADSGTSERMHTMCSSLKSRLPLKLAVPTTRLTLFSSTRVHELEIPSGPSRQIC